MEDSIDQAEKEAEPILKEGEKSLEIIKIFLRINLKRLQI